MKYVLLALAVALPAYAGQTSVDVTDYQGRNTTITVIYQDELGTPEPWYMLPIAPAADLLWRLGGVPVTDLDVSFEILSSDLPITFVGFRPDFDVTFPPVLRASAAIAPARSVTLFTYLLTDLDSGAAWQQSTVVPGPVIFDLHDSSEPRMSLRLDTHSHFEGSPYVAKMHNLEVAVAVPEPTTALAAGLLLLLLTFRLIALDDNKVRLSSSCIARQAKRRW